MHADSLSASLTVVLHQHGSRVGKLQYDMSRLPNEGIDGNVAYVTAFIWADRGDDLCCLKGTCLS